MQYCEIHKDTEEKVLSGVIQNERMGEHLSVIFFLLLFDSSISSTYLTEQISWIKEMPKFRSNENERPSNMRCSYVKIAPDFRYCVLPLLIDIEIINDQF